MTRKPKDIIKGVLYLVAAFAVSVLLGLCGCALKLPPKVDHASAVIPPLHAISTAQASETIEHAAVTTAHTGTRSDLASAFKWATSQPVLSNLLHSADSKVAEAEKHNLAAEKLNRAATTQVVAETVAVTKLNDDANGYQQKEAEYVKKINELNDCWVGPKTKRWALLLSITGAMLFATIGILRIPALTNPAIFLFREALKAIVTFGGSLVSHIVSGVMWLINWLHAHHVAGKAAIAAVVATPVNPATA